jgi:hypothetical protein
MGFQWRGQPPVILGCAQLLGILRRTHALYAWKLTVQHGALQSAHGSHALTPLPVKPGPSYLSLNDKEER